LRAPARRDGDLHLSGLGYRGFESVGPVSGSRHR
jgi:hypothetical protein